MQAPPNRNILLFQFQGIPIRVHRLLLILMGFMVLMAGSTTPDGSAGANMLSTGLALCLLFLTVLLHEMGHALVAKRLGVEVLEITLWPLGGMAMLRNMPEDAQVEGRIAAAGPLANLVLGALCLVLWIPLEGGFRTEALFSTRVDSLASALSFSALCHLSLGLFNLIPAFPMDGGKILRSHLAKTRDWLPATEAAAKIGRSMAWLMFFASIAFAEWGLFFISLYLFFAGSRELWSTRLKHMGAGGANPLTDMLLKMGRGRFPQDQEQGFDQETNAPLEEPPPSMPHGTSKGFSEEDIERMEAAKGPMRGKSND
ncbi:MAG: Zn-dependent protease [Planctomycetota bacterium]|jgi:Zn-dependent protease